MASSRTNFRAGDRVRGVQWFDEIAGAVGTGVEDVEVHESSAAYTPPAYVGGDEGIS